MRQVRFSRTGSSVITQQGGLVTSQSSIALAPGQMIECNNIELSDKQGWRRPNGTEPYDGRTEPHLAKYTNLATIDNVLSATAGDTVTFAGGSAILLIDFDYEADESITLFVISGDPTPVSTVLSVGGNPICTSNGTEELDDLTNDLEYTDLAVSAAMDQIQPVPGDGDITGEWSYKGEVYCFRDNLGESRLFKESSTGWQLITMPVQLWFDTGSAASTEDIPITGDTVTNGVATADIHRIQKTNDASFTWVTGGDAAGVITLINITGGTFSDSDALTFSTGATAVADGDQATIYRNSGGRLDADNYAFGGAEDALKMYGVDGVNPAFEFDGQYLSEIFTGLEDDSPEHIMITNYQLFVSKDGTWQVSPYGNPFDKWDNIRGADEWAMGDTIVGGLTLPNGTAISFAKNSISIIYINEDGTYSIRPYSNEYGSTEWSEQNAVSPLFLSSAGLTLISTTDRYGNFNMSTVDEDVFDIIQANKSGLECSTVFRNKKEYRLFFSTGASIRLKFGKKGLAGYSVDQYPFVVKGITSAKRSYGDETEDRVFFHTDDGYIYRMGVGDTFNGEDIVSSFRLPYNHLGNTRTKKQWYDIIVEVVAEKPGVEIGVRPIYQMYSKQRNQQKESTFEAKIEGGQWSKVDWSDFYWAAVSDDSDVRIKLRGVTPGLGLEFFSIGGAPYTIKNITPRFAVRGEVR